MIATKDQVIAACKKCFDPEIPVNVWDLGLIYDIDVNAQSGAILVKMSLTSQSCPSAQQIPNQLRQQIAQDCKTDEVEVEVVFEPAWTPERISEEGKKKLGIEDA
ncbi:MAG TPA: metal-sulfur cluster assembly factor [Verrucomicrobiae bacterium]|jgi:metal-sulfur cluster biosynthetic enzyme|nr:metal-sulfur cluster assembly factor [Verrucomicrobiae bacterium]